MLPLGLRFDPFSGPILPLGLRWSPWYSLVMLPLGALLRTDNDSGAMLPRGLLFPSGTKLWRGLLLQREIKGDSGTSGNCGIYLMQSSGLGLIFWFHVLLSDGVRLGRGLLSGTKLFLGLLLKSCPARLKRELYTLVSGTRLCLGLRFESGTKLFLGLLLMAASGTRLFLALLLYESEGPLFLGLMDPSGTRLFLEPLEYASFGTKLSL